MEPVVLQNFTTVNALGRGVTATFKALEEGRSGLRPCDFEGSKLGMFIGRVEGLESSPVTGDLSLFDCRNNRLALLGMQQDGFEDAVARARERFGPERIAVVMGTSTSGILAVEHAYRERTPENGALPSSFCARSRFTNSMFSLADFVQRYLSLKGPATVISTACSSSAKAFVSASRLIATGVSDAVVVGGVDSLCFNTLYGFLSLELVSQEPCRPFDTERKGLSLGEAAGFVLLQRVEPGSEANSIALLGYGESSDGCHMSHPHPEGKGAALAMGQALACADLTPHDIDYINLHGTATRTNDAIEDLAVDTMFGGVVPCSSTKGWTGHTLGAAGAVETIICALSIQKHFIPGTLNTRTLDPAIKSPVQLTNKSHPVRRVLNNLFGFGGSNCSLILGNL